MGFFGTGDDDSVHVKRRRPDGPADASPTSWTQPGVGGYQCTDFITRGRFSVAMR